MTTSIQNLIGLRTLSRTDIQFLLDQSEGFLNPEAPSPWFSQKIVVLLFFEPSTRTRVSFELAVRRLGAIPLVVDIEKSSAKKGETVLDTVRNIEAMGVDAFVIRHSESGLPEQLSTLIHTPILNAGDGVNEHPTQGLLDLFTLRSKLGELAGKKILILGDIKHSRVARSNIFGLNTLGAKVFISGPPALMPSSADGLDVTIVRSPDEVIGEVDAVNVLRIQRERQDSGECPPVDEYRRLYGMTEERVARLNPSAWILHPGPINRGVEIDDSVVDHGQSLILTQVRNGVAVRMACLNALLVSPK